MPPPPLKLLAALAASLSLTLTGAASPTPLSTPLSAPASAPVSAPAPDVDATTLLPVGPSAAALSRDGGKTWIDQGPVIENPYGIDCTYDNGFFVGGSGDFHVLPDQQRGYFYFLFSNYAGPIDQQGVAVARSAFKDRGQPG